MTGYQLPQFARTNGKRQKSSEVGLSDSPTSKSQSLFKTLKSKLSRTNRSMGSNMSFDAASETVEDKSYFIKTAGNVTKQVNAFPWAGDNTLQAYAAVGDCEGVRRRLNVGEDPDGVDDDGNTALHKASEAGWSDLVVLLLARGADPDAQNIDGDRPLHKAAASEKPEIITLLVAGSANINAQSGEGWTPLHEASCSHRSDTLRTLLHLGADVHKRTREGDTALHKAARWGNYESCRLLLLMGCDASARDKQGREPLHRTNVEEIVRLLVTSKWQQAKDKEMPPPPTSQSHSSSTQSKSSNDTEDDEWDLVEQRNFYEVQWALFASDKNPVKKISFSDVPWPGSSTSSKAIMEVILHGADTPEEKRKRMRVELLRWHPDKFHGNFGQHILKEDFEQIMAKVTEISQAISSVGR